VVCCLYPSPLPKLGNSIENQQHLKKDQKKADYPSREQTVPDFGQHNRSRLTNTLQCCYAKKMRIKIPRAHSAARSAQGKGARSLSRRGARSRARRRTWAELLSAGRLSPPVPKAVVTPPQSAHPRQGRREHNVRAGGAFTGFRIDLFLARKILL